MDAYWNEIRKEFPILETEVSGNKLIYLDNAATVQIPECVSREMYDFINTANANVHRGMHYLSMKATRMQEEAREKIRKFLKADDSYEVIFTSGTTHSVNLAAFGLKNSLQEGDDVSVSILEHHSNLLPWRRAAEASGASFNLIPCPDGNFDLETFSAETGKINAVTSVSNLTGSVLPLKEIVNVAHRKGTLVLVDGAQAVRHSESDVEETKCDLYAFSGHKMCAPTGIGVLLGKKDVLRKFEPLMPGGGTVSEVTETTRTFDDIPYRLEGGTPNIIGITGLAKAAEFLDDIGRKLIAEREKELTDALADTVKKTEGLRIIGDPEKRQGIISFNVGGINSYDIAQLLDKQGIAVRSGTHCAEPALKSFGVKDAVRASIAFYNTFEEIEYFGQALSKTVKLLMKYK
ncbi:MAG: aminotransferase class V-fold PLP-dependent enzyme [Saccharofermentanales bacterium]|jgi:cysteine desulfurase/selenocysteine lyase